MPVQSAGASGNQISERLLQAVNWLLLLCSSHHLLHSAGLLKEGGRRNVGLIFVILVLRDDKNGACSAGFMEQWYR